jgi:hypothetical protein
MARSVVKACLRFTGLFEAELLTELMLRFWNHPLADDSAFRSGLLEAAAEVLRMSANGERLFQELDPQRVNFVAAIWHAESVSLAERGDIPSTERALREKWLNALLKSVPSCFCDPDLLK